LGISYRTVKRDTWVLRIVQEALTNVARHAKADTVSVCGRVDDGELFVEVEGNGIGVTDREVTSPESLGLIGMREGADGVGGEVHFKRPPRAARP
jgi:signal transduction histidine kinase